MRRLVCILISILTLSCLAGCSSQNEQLHIVAENEDVRNVSEQQNLEPLEIYVPELLEETVKNDMLANIEIHKHKGQDVELKEINILDSSIIEVSRLGKTQGLKCDIYAEIKVIAANMIRTTNYSIIYRFMPGESDDWVFESVELQGIAQYAPIKAIDVSELPEWLDITADTELIETIDYTENNLVVFKFNQQDGKQFIVNCSIDEMNRAWVFEKLYLDDAGDVNSEN